MLLQLVTFGQDWVNLLNLSKKLITDLANEARLGCTDADRDLVVARPIKSGAIDDTALLQALKDELVSLEDGESLQDAPHNYVAGLRILTDRD